MSRESADVQRPQTHEQLHLLMSVRLCVSNQAFCFDSMRQKKNFETVQLFIIRYLYLYDISCEILFLDRTISIFYVLLN